MSFPKVLKKGGKIILWMIGILTGMLLIAVLVLQLPSVQTYLTHRVAGFLKKKLKTKVEVKGINVGFPKFIVLDGLYVEDLKKDTLLYSGHLAVDMDFWALRKKKVTINKIVLENVSGHVYRTNTDSTYNYEFIIKAFSDSVTVTDKDSAATPWKISIDKIKLGKIYLTFKDEIARTDLLLRLGECNMAFETLDIEKSVYKIDKFQLAHTTLSFTDKSEPAVPSSQAVPSSDSNSPALSTGLKELDLEDIHVFYQNNGGGQTLKTDLGKVLLKADTLDITNRQIAVKSFTLEKSFITYRQESKPALKAADNLHQVPTGKPAQIKPWQVHVGEIILAKNYLAYNDFGQTPKMKGVDFAHLFVSDLNGKAKDIVYAGNALQATLESLNLKEKSGFEVKTLQAKILVEDTEASLSEFLFETPHSHFSGNITTTYASIESIAATYPEAGINADIKPSHLAIEDVLYFQPDLPAMLPLRISNMVFLDFQSKVRGKVKNLYIEDFKAHTLHSTNLSVKGTIQNLPDINKAVFAIDIKGFETSSSDIHALLPLAMLPPNIVLPEKMTLLAKLSGATHNLNAKATLYTSLGNAQTNFNLKTTADFSNGSYRGNLQVIHAELGKLLRQEETLGKCSMALGISGSGFRPEVMDAKINTKISLFEYRQYAYRNLTADLRAKALLYSGKAELADSNLHFTFSGSADLRKEIPGYVAELDLKNISLKALHLAGQDLRSHIKLKADLHFKEIDNINGSLDIRKLAIVSRGKVYAVDSLLYVSFQEKEKTDIKIDSDILSGHFHGNINLSGLAGALTNHFNRYFALNDKVKEAKPQQFDFELKLRNPDIFTAILVPDLDSLKPGLIKGSFDSQTSRLDFNTQVYLLKYAGVRVDSFQVAVTSDAQSLKAAIQVAGIKHPNIHIYHSKLVTEVKNDSILTRLTLLDSLQHQKYNINAIANSINKEFMIHILPDSLLINAGLWNVNPENNMLFTKKGFLINNVDLSSGSQHLVLDNVDKQPSSIKAAFKDFELATLTTLIQSDSNWVTGLLNGEARLFRQDKDTVFTSGLTVTNLKYEGMEIGNINLTAEQKQPRRFDVGFSLTGNANDLRINGYYLTKGDNPINFNVDCRKLEFATFAPFVKDQLKNFSGTGSGLLKVTGTADSPQLNGNFTFADTKFTVVQLNNTFKTDKQTLYFDNAGLHVNNFSLQDENNKTATITGDLLTGNYRFYRFRLHASGNDFQVLNSSVTDNEMYYGKLFVNVEADIKGNSNKPVIAANVKVGANSNLTYVVQQSNGTVAGQEGIIEYFDADVENDVFVQRMIKQTAPDSARSAMKGFEMTTNIEIDSASTFTIVIDPLAGDQLKVKGETTLSLSIDPSGEIDLTGRYQVLSGTYNLSFFNLIKREFAISRNSSITWSGDPLAATLDIQATYKVVTSPLELMQNRLTSDRDKQDYRQRMSFLVSLNMKGILTKPEINFGLAMGQDKQNDLSRNVDVRLKEINADPSELNKQVFALFLLQRFFAENPLESSSSSTESTVRTSVSKMLTEQLNRLASQVKGIELQLDVNSFQDYSSGSGQGKTQLELGVSKNLFNDRLVVKVAGNVNLEGSSATSQQNLSDFVGDLRLEYKVTKDGRLRITGFRQRSFDLVSGELIETGGGIIYIRDYNAFRELFSSKTSE